ncbi:LysR family transcriptional regulator [Paracoccaceae bacterium]
MTRSQIDWALWRTFLVVADSGSLSAAARHLGLSQPTVGRHIEQLETSIGRRLFLRSQQGYLPTEEASALIPDAKDMAFVAEGLERRASASTDDSTGIIRLAASHVVGTEILPRLLVSFMEAHPGLEVELALSNSNADLLRHEADVAVRMVRPTQDNLLARRIGTAFAGLYARTEYLDRHGRPTALADLSGHRLIGPDRDAASISFLEGLDPALSRRSLRLRCDSEAAQLSALRAGMGIGICQRGIAARDASLEPVLPQSFRFPMECWLVTHDDLRHVRRIRLLFDHLASTLPEWL